ncbi:MAG: orotate phosphoribosyltransferase [Candidatus Omnitrophica bacterium]|nr:orotate phosphoribosyltransferase [Candidatus Omnitrophota bacterium]
MNPKQILQIFKRKDALLEGHFILSSGLHSGQYLQCAKVLEDPKASARLARALAANFGKRRVDTVVGPAMGGIILAYELARALGARALFAERANGKMCLRRGFSLKAQEKVLVAEDVITTGGSVKEVIEVVQACGATVIGVAALIDRSGRKPPFGKIRFKSLAKIDIKTYRPEDCPLCRQGLGLIKPGSRK